MLDGDYVALNQDNRDVLLVPCRHGERSGIGGAQHVKCKAEIGLDFARRSLLLRLCLARSCAPLRGPRRA